MVSYVRVMQECHSKPRVQGKLLQVQVDVPKATQPCPLQVPEQTGTAPNLTLQPAFVKKFSDTEKYIWQVHSEFC